MTTSETVVDILDDKDGFSESLLLVREVELGSDPTFGVFSEAEMLSSETVAETRCFPRPLATTGVGAADHSSKTDELGISSDTDGAVDTSDAGVCSSSNVGVGCDSLDEEKVSAALEVVASLLGATPM